VSADIALSLSGLSATDADKKLLIDSGTITRMRLKELFYIVNFEAVKTLSEMGSTDRLEVSLTQ
jgi:hypothetical protein